MAIFSPDLINITLFIFGIIAAGLVLIYTALYSEEEGESESEKL